MKFQWTRSRQDTDPVKRKRRAIARSAAAAVAAALLAWSIWCNTALELNRYTVESGEIPQAFDGFCIAHISDLHNAEMGRDNEKLLSLLRNASPDLIAITGDLIDSRNTDIDIALDFVQSAMEIAPCCYVTGNHEARVPEYYELRIGMQAAGVHILNNKTIDITLNGQAVTVIGVDDPSFHTDYLFGDGETVIASTLEELISENEGFMVLLSHRPELFDTYAESDVDLVLSGHAHGGQFRLPFVGGLFAPNQGFFPKYDGGVYTEDNTNMIVSRGIGNSVIPLRLNNRPEVLLIELAKES